MSFTNATTENVMNSTNTSASEIALYTRDIADRIINLAVENIFGNPDITGLALVVGMQYLMIQNEVDKIVQMVTVTPILMVLGYNGFLPFGEGLLFGVFISVAFLAAIGVLKYFET